MFNKKDFVIKNYLKFASLFFAIIMWMVAHNNFDPKKTESFKLKLQIKNLDVLKSNGYILANQTEIEQKEVTIYINDYDSRIKKMKEMQNDISAYIDLKPIDYSRTNKLGEKLSANVYYKLPNGFTNETIVNRSLSEIDVVLDKNIEIEKEITVTTEGVVSEGFLDMHYEVTPKTVFIRGAKSIVDKVSIVSIQVDLQNATKDISKNATPKVFDKDNKDITSLVSVSEINVRVVVPVNKLQKININPPTYTGTLAEGYVITDVSCNPEFIEVVGRTEDIESLKSIQLKTIDVDGLDKTLTLPINLYDYIKGKNLSIRNGTNFEAVVTIEIEKEITKEFEIPLSQIEIKGMQSSVEIEDEPVKLSILATESQMNSLDIANIKGFVDLTGLEPGTYDLAVLFNLPDWAKQVNYQAQIKIRIYDQEEQQEVSPLPLTNNTD